jgi:hypothetical protein
MFPAFLKLAMQSTETDFLCQGDSSTVCSLGRGLIGCQASPPLRQRDDPRGYYWFPQSAAFVTHSAALSADYPIRPRQHPLRNRDTDLHGRLEIDHQLELRRLFDG